MAQAHPQIVPQPRPGEQGLRISDAAALLRRSRATVSTLSGPGGPIRRTGSWIDAGGRKCPLLNPQDVLALAEILETRQRQARATRESAFGPIEGEAGYRFGYAAALCGVRRSTVSGWTDPQGPGHPALGARDDQVGPPWNPVQITGEWRDALGQTWPLADQVQIDKIVHWIQDPQIPGYILIDDVPARFPFTRRQIENWHYTKCVWLGRPLRGTKVRALDARQRTIERQFLKLEDLAKIAEQRGARQAGPGRHLLPIDAFADRVNSLWRAAGGRPADVSANSAPLARKQVVSWLRLGLSPIYDRPLHARLVSRPCRGRGRNEHWLIDASEAERIVAVEMTWRNAHWLATAIGWSQSRVKQWLGTANCPFLDQETLRANVRRFRCAVGTGSRPQHRIHAAAARRIVLTIAERTIGRQGAALRRIADQLQSAVDAFGERSARILAGEDCPSEFAALDLPVDRREASW